MSQETILIIDDEKEIRALIGIYLTNEGYNVLKAADALRGWNTWKRKRFIWIE